MGFAEAKTGRATSDTEARSEAPENAALTSEEQKKLSWIIPVLTSEHGSITAFSRYPRGHGGTEPSLIAD
jgi:hypothetical protein